MAFFSRIPTDAAIIEGIRSGRSQRRPFENQLYEKYHYLIRMGIRKHRLSEDESSMAYSDTVLTVIEHLVSGRYEGRSGLKTYIHQIFSNKCVDHIRRKTTNKAQVYQSEALTEVLSILPDEARLAIQQIIQKQDGDLLRQRLETLGEKCRRILWAWGEGQKDQEIATELGYQSGAVAKTTRLRCLEKLKELYQAEKKQ